MLPILMRPSSIVMMVVKAMALIGIARRELTWLRILLNGRPLSRLKAHVVRLADARIAKTAATAEATMPHVIAVVALVEPVAP